MVSLPFSRYSYIVAANFRTKNKVKTTSLVYFDYGAFFCNRFQMSWNFTFIAVVIIYICPHRISNKIRHTDFFLVRLKENKTKETVAALFYQSFSREILKLKNI